MADLRMKLDAIKPPRLVRNGHMGAGLGVCRQPKTRRDTRHIVPMAHPGDAFLREALEDGTGPIIPGHGFSILSGRILLSRGHLSAQRLGQQLTAVADPKHRDPKFKDRRVHLGGPRLIYAARPPGKDDPDGRKDTDVLHRHGVWVDLAVDFALAYPPGNQLIILTAEIQNQDALHRILLIDQCHRFGRASPCAWTPAEFFVQTDPYPHGSGSRWGMRRRSRRCRSRCIPLRSARGALH